MSLVNDMLKDLDARRRGVPVKGNAAKKLTPASERQRRSESSKLPFIITCAVAVVVILFILWMLLSDGDNSGQLADLRSGTERAATGVATDAEREESVSSAGQQGQPGSANDAVTEGSGNAGTEAATIAALQARLAELEAANSAGAALTNPNDASPAGGWNSVDWTGNTQPGAQPASGNSGSQQSAASGNLAPMAEAQSLQPAAGSETESLTEPVIARQTREMPLSERDRLQVQDALTLWSQGQQLTALQMLDGFAYENPEAHQSRETLAKLLIQQGEIERALQAAELGLQISPAHPGYKKVKARILLGQSEVPDALALLAATPPSVANDPEYHNLLATAQLAGGEYTDAIESYQSLLRLADPRIDTAPLLYGLGSAHLRVGNAAEARQVYQQALQQPGLSANLRAQIERRLASPAPAQ
ncbi:MAG: tetratricopeptide repeat protein [Pseudohongiella nitratireducens]|nr:tetratricopeptide repeat protein [Pseudohongiella nitratireducens]